MSRTPLLRNPLNTIATAGLLARRALAIAFPGRGVPSPERARAGVGAAGHVGLATVAPAATATATIRRWAGVPVAGALAASLIALVPAPATAADDCPNADIRAKQGATHLPDCRAYELVSPAEKEGAHVGQSGALGFISRVQASIAPDGNSITYENELPLPGQTRDDERLIATRSDDGWINDGLLGPPGPTQVSFVGGYRAMFDSTPDNATTAYFDLSTEPFGGLWLARSNGAFANVVNAPAFAPPQLGWTNAVGANVRQPFFEGISDDGKHVVFGSTERLLPGLPPGNSEILYEWVDDGSPDGTLRVVNRTNDSELTLIDPDESAVLGGSAQHTTARGDKRSISNAISADGSKIFFQSPPAERAEIGYSIGGGPLYVREDGETTTELSAPAPGHNPVNPPTKVQYLDASHSAEDPSIDGRYVFYWANGDLTADAPSAGGVYRYDLTADQLNFVAEAPEVATETSGVDRPPTGIVSGDGSHLYFERGNPTGRPDIVLATTAGTKVIITATPMGGEPAVGSDNPQLTGKLTEVGLHRTQCTSANVSPDGRFFVFSAQPSSALNTKVYRYDAQADQLDVVSTSPDAPATPYDAGFPAVGTCQTITDSGAAPAASFARTVNGRVMSDDGSYVFFETYVPLVPEDNNGNWDVYQWHDGEVSLISRGTTAGRHGHSHFIGTDRNGRSAFLTTNDQLIQADGDGVLDIYAARVDGGIEAQNEVPRAGCQGGDCQGAPNSPPAQQDPQTIGAQPGNPSGVAPKSCEAFARLAKKARARSKRLSKRAARLERSAHKARKRDSRAKAIRLTRTGRKASLRSRKKDAQAARWASKAKRCRQGGAS